MYNRILRSEKLPMDHLIQSSLMVISNLLNILLPAKMKSGNYFSQQMNSGKNVLKNTGIL